MVISGIGLDGEKDSNAGRAERGGFTSSCPETPFRFVLFLGVLRRAEAGGASMRRAARQSAWLRDQSDVSDVGFNGRRSDL